MAVAADSPLPNPDDFQPKDQPNGRIIVNGVEIPGMDADIHERKEGDLDITRYAEGKFASPWEGEDYESLFQTTSPNTQDEFDTVRIDVLDYATEEYYPEFYGYVTGVGNAETGPDRVRQFRAQGPAHLLSDIPASETFENATIEHVMETVVSQLNNRLPATIATDLGFDVSEQVQQFDASRITGRDNHLDRLIFGGQVIADQLDDATPGNLVGDPLQTSHTFHFGEDSLADILQWLGRKAGLYLWFEPTREGVVLVATQQPNTADHVAYNINEDGTLLLRDNDALSELKPANTLVVKAPAKGSSSGNANKIAVAKARHTGLYQRAGETELHASTHRLKNTRSKTAVEREARKRLKTTIDETTAGDMTALARGGISPYDTIEALPTTTDRLDDITPVTYEVSRVHHDLTSGPFPLTELNVGLHTDVESDIEIVDSWLEARGA